MLTHIHVRNLAIVDEIEVELTAGMTTLSGETGAGKSILVDALGLVLGDRADSSVIRHGCERAEISAAFYIQEHPAICRWLAEQELDRDGECQLRRIINREGRTRGYINGQAVPMQSLRELGEQLVDIHGQHEHQSLLRSAVQRQILDGFGTHQPLLDRLASLYNDWKTVTAELQGAFENDAERDARLDLLRYQGQELESLGLDREDIRNIDEEHARQANAGRLLESSRQGLERLDADEAPSASSLLHQTLDELGELAAVDSGLEETTRLLGEAAVLLRESIDSLRHYAERLDIDPQRLQWLEQRIGILHDLARKHRCNPEDLPAIEANIRKELDTIEHADEHREALQARLANLQQDYQDSARQLTAKRTRTAKAFSRKITDAMQTLGMAGGVFSVRIKPRAGKAFGPQGMDDIEFMVSANSGQPLQPMSKVASGGELSRISLSIQVISAGSDTIPSLIFDEVDSGIGGGVAEIVGQKLRALGMERQVLCVTHLPQVAALAHQQLQVSKLSGKDTTRIRIRTLNEEERIDELARMLGGVRITRQTREHAREMLLQGQSPEHTPAKKRNSRQDAKIAKL
ncbi:MAG: DNA repair protein RecN [Gammaproteobacteria bacterium]|jgi:DNA repair protein RecN (Recombination protein N)